MDSPKEYYQQRIELLSGEINKLKAKDQKFLMSEIFSFLGAVAILLAVLIAHLDILWLLLSAVCLGTNAILRYFDAKREKAIHQKVSLLTVYQNEIAALEGDFSSFQDGEQYVNPAHHFTFDLDIFGKNSLFNRINRTVTTGGSDKLANKLSLEKLPVAQYITEWNAAVSEVSSMTDFRSKWMTIKETGSLDTKKIISDTSKLLNSDTKQFPSKTISHILICALIATFCVSIYLAYKGIIRDTIPGLLSVIQLCVGYLGCGKSLKKVAKEIKGASLQMKKCTQLIKWIDENSFNTQIPSELKNVLHIKKCNAVDAFEKASEITKTLEIRNDVWALVSNMLYVGDFFTLRKLLKWRRIQLEYFEKWIDTVCEFDKLVSMATFQYNHPQNIFAKVTDDENIVLEAKDFYHPFLGEKAVANDFNIHDGHYYIVTGANMAGKSTFLRAVGVNYILAMCGMPVCAKEMKASIFSLFSSMRTTDDLTRGISYFKAELLRLQQLINYCKQNKKTLIILDEILRGTNSLDKLNGSKLFLKHISKLPVSGIIATHDLELSKMEDSYPEKFHSYCFEILLSDKITYSYKISRGVARNQNATFLLNKMLQEC